MLVVEFQWGSQRHHSTVYGTRNELLVEDHIDLTSKSTVAVIAGRDVDFSVMNEMHSDGVAGMQRIGREGQVQHILRGFGRTEPESRTVSTNTHMVVGSIQSADEAVHGTGDSMCGSGEGVLGVIGGGGSGSDGDLAFDCGSDGHTSQEEETRALSSHGKDTLAIHGVYALGCRSERSSVAGRNDKRITLVEDDIGIKCKRVGGAGVDQV